MLTLTDNATTIVKSLTAQPGTNGLRISSDGASEGLAVATVDEPRTEDQVVEQDGATVYLDESASQQLTDKVLDAGVDSAGNLQFSLDLQANQ
ncbi:MAG: Fe-S cluster assembly protein HesB [Nocardioidaceae bacterium]|nr:Fe-S cluster assembly protein HesB [Nocardioidaceae bacterium]MCL2613830.1 Fe-S cluster assembly protein HesB [Nocardioidaceae bacterium]